MIYAMIKFKPNGYMLSVKGLGGNEVAYNPAVIIQKNSNKIAEGANIIAVRIESIDSDWLNPQQYDPHIQFFTRENDDLIPIPNTPIFQQYEDPWATWLTKDNYSQLLFGGVKVDFRSTAPVITTHLFLASSVQELDVNNPFAIIKNMKDVRVVELKSKKIAVFTRPLTGKAYPGSIGFTIIDSIKDIETAITSAKLLPFSLDKNARIGTNEAYTIEKTNSLGITEELIHVFCHVATTDPTNIDGNNLYDFDRGIIHYAGYQFELNPNHPLKTTISLHRVADRSDFPVNDKYSKGKRFDDVIFPGGTGGQAETEYFVGVEDARVGVMNLK